MPTQPTLLAFALVSAAIMVIPGPSNLFLLAHGIGHGRRSALAAMTGIEAASAIRVLLAAAGLSAVLASSAVAFNAIRWAGVTYLAWLGIRAFRAGHPGWRTWYVRNPAAGIVHWYASPGRFPLSATSPAELSALIDADQAGH